MPARPLKRSTRPRDPLVSHQVVGGQFPKTRLSERPLLAESSHSFICDENVPH